VKVRRVDFYPDDWIAGTIGLTHEQRSVYISVCAAIWSYGGQAPLKFVRQICPGPHFKRALDGLVAIGKISLEMDSNRPESGPKVAQKRAESELKVARIRTETALANGSKGGRPNKLAEPDGFSPEKPTNTNTNTIKEERKMSADADSARAKPKPKATTLPEDWTPDESDRMYAEERGLDPNEMLPEWRNYWCYEGGKNVKRVDWSLTWKDRCRTLAKRQGGNGQARSGRNHANGGGVVAAMRELWLEENDGCLPH
jgi:hypothetical protein